MNSTTRPASAQQLERGTNSLSPSEGERLHERAFAICCPEPTPNPSQEGNCARAFTGLLPSLEGLGVGRFMGRVVEDRVRGSLGSIRAFVYFAYFAV